jgi:hypothetical protein
MNVNHSNIAAYKAAKAPVDALIAEKKFDEAITLAIEKRIDHNPDTGKTYKWFQDLQNQQKRAFNARMAMLESRPLIREVTLPSIEYVGRLPSVRFGKPPVGNALSSVNARLPWATPEHTREEILLPAVTYDIYGKIFYPERATPEGTGNLAKQMAALAPTVKPTGVKPTIADYYAAKMGLVRARSKKSNRTRRSKYTLKRR